MIFRKSSTLTIKEPFQIQSRIKDREREKIMLLKGGSLWQKSTIYISASIPLMVLFNGSFAGDILILISETKSNPVNQTRVFRSIQGWDGTDIKYLRRKCWILWHCLVVFMLAHDVISSLLMADIKYHIGIYTSRKAFTLDCILLLEHEIRGYLCRKSPHLSYTLT